VKVSSSFPQCYCSLYCISLWSESGNSKLLSTETFQISFIHENLKINNTLNIQDLVTALDIYIVIY
jgi:hypothetical protein